MRDNEYHARLTVRVLQIVRVRTKEDPVQCRVIAAMVGIKENRVVTHIIESLRDAGEWICASQEPPYGYYYAKNRMELEEYLQKEHDRVMNQLVRHKKQRDFIPPPMELFEVETIHG